MLWRWLIWSWLFDLLFVLWYTWVSKISNDYNILSDIDVNVESREMEDCHRINKSNNGSKKTIIRFIYRKYSRKALLNRKQLERIDLKTSVCKWHKDFFNENQTIKNKHLVFNCRQLKKRNYYLARLRGMGLFILNKMKILDQW